MPEARALRTRVLSVRLTPAELEALLERSAACGLPVSRYVREASLGSVPRARPRRVEERAVYHLSRIGNNLNQLARAANTTGRVDASGRLEAAIRELMATLERLA